ncbi:hypothetical protein N8611_02640 [bacterium]|nr:hypothetical protein [bacterium]
MTGDIVGPKLSVDIADAHSNTVSTLLSISTQATRLGSATTVSRSSFLPTTMRS